MRERFGDLFVAQSNVVCGTDVDSQLGLAATEGRQDAEGDELPPPRVETGAVVDVTEVKAAT